MEKTVLYIDDHERNRRRGIISLEKTGINKFLAPLSEIECINLINPLELKAAIVDLKLEEWVGKNYERSFQFKGREISDGLDLAKALLAENPAMKIGLFSAGNDLMEKVKNAGLKNKVDVIDIKVEPGQDKHFYVPGYLGILLDQDNLAASDLIEATRENQYHPKIPIIKLKPDLLSVNTGLADFGYQHYSEDYVEEKTDTETILPETNEDTFTLKTYIRSYYPSSENPAKNIQLFLAKKILYPTETGTHFWKIGGYRWIVSLGERISEHYLNDTSVSNMVESSDEFEMKIENESYRMTSFYAKDRNFLITADNYREVLHSQDKPGQYDILCQMFVVKYICKLFLDKKISTTETIDTLLTLGDIAKFQSQKLLFISLLENIYFQVSTKEDAYKILAPFSDAGLPMILEVFKGSVRYIGEGKAAVKLVSISDPDRVRLDYFSRELLQTYLLVEGSNFEYTVHKPPYGGFGYNIEPI